MVNSEIETVISYMPVISAWVSSIVNVESIIIQMETQEDGTTQGSDGQVWKKHKAGEHRTIIAVTADGMMHAKVLLKVDGKWSDIPSSHRCKYARCQGSYKDEISLHYQ